MRKKEFIEYLVEECYSNFPELIEKFSKEGLYKTLNRNINMIRIGGQHSLWAGSYMPIFKRISFYNIDEISLEQLEKNGDLKSTASHEGIHALFKKGIDATGCHNYSVFNISRDLKKFAKQNIMKFRSSISVREKIQTLANIPKSYYTIFEYGRGLNEGFTEWVNSKCTSFAYSYEHEVNIIRQLEQFRDKKDILKIGDGDIGQIASLFNMDYIEFNVFLRSN